MNKKVGIIGVPIHLGQGIDGVDLGPQAVRYSLLCDTLQEMDYEVQDTGDISFVSRDRAEVGLDNAKYVDQVRELNEILCNKVDTVLEKGFFPLLIGGDHSMAIGTVAGVQKHHKNLGLIWVDAHGDLNTPDTSPSGNIHGMSLAVNLGLGHPSLTSIGSSLPKVLPSKTVIVGARDLDAGEREIIKELGIRVFTAHEIEQYGIAHVMDRALEIVSEGTDGVHVSFDLDVLDPQVVQGIGTPVPAGLTYREAHLLLRMLYDSQVVTSAEFVEVNPLLDNMNQTAKVTVGLIRALFGERLTNTNFGGTMVEAHR